MRKITTTNTELTKLAIYGNHLTLQNLLYADSKCRKIKYFRKRFFGYDWTAIWIHFTVFANYLLNGFVTALNEGLQLKLNPKLVFFTNRDRHGTRRNPMLELELQLLPEYQTLFFNFWIPEFIKRFYGLFLTEQLSFFLASPVQRTTQASY